MAIKKKPSKKVVKKPNTKATKKVGAKPAKKSTAKKKPTKLKKVNTLKTKKKRKPETLMCFLTTACVHYYNLADNGYELNTLRSYRDTYLKSSPAGKRLVEQYYRISPEIVNCIESDNEKSGVYAFIHNRVLKACGQIEQQKYSAARTTYKNMVEHLLSRYQLSYQ
ncbi:MAG: hypothetical protein JNL60_15495 [Bacteroidia bacterium]|nr:hypothetical protein [Bacteroidia bacterium]